MLTVELLEEIIKKSLSLPESSLVVFREKLLIEFKTDQIREKLVQQNESGFVSWQVGPLDGHHLHLDLHVIQSIQFGAEPVSCQQGRLNFTIWFEANRSMGNPFRPKAYFSVVFNHPYLPQGSLREDLVFKMVEIFNLYRDYPFVQADINFMDFVTKYSSKS